MNELIKISSLTKEYHNGAAHVAALRDVSFSLDAGDYVGIVGPSGAGKSTLLHSVGGLEPPTQGAVIFKGKNIYQMKDREISLWRNKAIGFVFQFYHLIEELNVLDNIILPSFSKKRKSSFKKAQKLLKYLGIEARATFFPSQLSGGEKQKVAIARAVVNDPEIILCDEPTGNLDKDSADNVILLLESLHRNEKRTLVIVTHNHDLVKGADRVIHISDGRIEST